MAETNLVAERRERAGKGAARAIRRQGRVPAVIYGGGEPPLPITLPYKEIDHAIHSGGFLSSVREIDVEGKTIRVLPKDFQLDSVKEFPLHVDFLRVARGATLTVEVPVQFVGEEDSPGIERGGALNVVRHTIEVHARARDLPEALIADVSKLEINDSLHVSEIALPDGVELAVTDRDFTVVSITAPAGFGEDLDAPVEEGETEVIEQDGETIEPGEGDETEGEAESSGDSESGENDKS